jgi:uncharacterized membrane protein YphA (DoxX/SURF4 family)
LEIVSIVLQSLLILVFLGSGVSKTAGAKMHVDNFNGWKLPQWFRVVTGLVQIVGVIALVIGFWEPSWAAAAGLWLGITMFGGILVHIRAKDSIRQTIPAIVLCILPLIVFIIQLSELADFPGF